MSRQNGDKARFHRIRKANSLRRKKTRELRQQMRLSADAAPAGRTGASKER